MIKHTMDSEHIKSAGENIGCHQEGKKEQVMEILNYHDSEGGMGCNQEDCADEIIKLLEAIATQKLKEGMTRALEHLYRIELHLEASVCDCGEPLKETDAYDATVEAITAIREEIENLTQPKEQGV